MNAITTQTTDESMARLEHLAELSQRLLERAKTRGATQAEVSCSEETGLNVNVRMGAVETVESNRDRGIGVTVYFGKRKGSASTADLREESLDATVEQACAIAHARGKHLVEQLGARGVVDLPELRVHAHARGRVPADA